MSRATRRASDADRENRPSRLRGCGGRWMTMREIMCSVDPKKEAAQLALPCVDIAGRWRHYKGGLYDVICCAVEEATLRPVVIYRSVERGYIWSRSAEEWLGHVDVGGATVRRFVRVGVDDHALNDAGETSERTSWPCGPATMTPCCNGPPLSVRSDRRAPMPDEGWLLTLEPTWRMSAMAEEVDGSTDVARSAAIVATDPAPRLVRINDELERHYREVERLEALAAALIRARSNVSIERVSNAIDAAVVTAERLLLAEDEEASR